MRPSAPLKDIEPAYLRYTVGLAHDTSTRSLDLLREIEFVVSANGRVAHDFGLLSGALMEIVKSLCGLAHDRRVILDKDGVFAVRVDEVVLLGGAIIGVLTAKRQSAIDDKALRPEDGVADSFSAAIEAVCTFVDHLNELKWAVLENDAEISPVDPAGPYTDVEAFIASLRG